MDKPKQTLTQTILARISLGAVPMGGFYWFDPKSVSDLARKSNKGAQHECRSDRDQLNRAGGVAVSSACR